MPNKKKNKNKQKSSPIPKAQEKALAHKIAREVRSAPKGSRKGARWGFKLGGLSAGPVGVQDLEFNSGSSKKARSARSLSGVGSGSGNGWVQGIAHSAMNMQVSMPRIVSSMRPDGVMVDVLEGTDLIGPVVVPDNTATGDILLEKYINPSVFSGTRMNQFSVLYQRFRLLSIKFIYQPIASAETNGQLIGYCTYDPDSPLDGDTPTNVQKAAAFFGNRQNQVWEPAEYVQRQLTTMTDLYVDPNGADTRFSYQGIFYLLAAGDIALGGTMGNVYVQYKLELSIPQLEPGLGNTISGGTTVNGGGVVSGNITPFGTSFTQDAGGQLDIIWTSGTQLQIQGVHTGSQILFMFFTTSLSGSGGAAYSSGQTATWSGATTTRESGNYTIYNGAGGSAQYIADVLVTSVSGTITLSLDYTTGGSLTTSSYAAHIFAVQIPGDPIAAIYARREREAMVDRLVSHFAGKLHLFEEADSRPHRKFERRLLGETPGTSGSMSSRPDTQQDESPGQGHTPTIIQSPSGAVNRDPVRYRFSGSHLRS